MSIENPETFGERLQHEAYQKGRDAMREQVIDLIRTCLDRQPDLQKVIAAVENFD